MRRRFNLYYALASEGARDERGMSTFSANDIAPLRDTEKLRGSGGRLHLFTRGADRRSMGDKVVVRGDQIHVYEGGGSRGRGTS